MSFKAKLNLDGDEYNVLNCSYELDRDTDSYGKPSSDVRGGKISIKVESTQNTKLTEWMMNAYERKNGSIVFLKQEEDSTKKELKFSDAYMVRYLENFDHEGKNPMTEEFTVSARQIEIGDGEFSNEWVG